MQNYRRDFSNILTQETVLGEWLQPMLDALKRRMRALTRLPRQKTERANTEE